MLIDLDLLRGLPRLRETAQELTQIAQALGAPPEPFVLAVLFGANLSFVTPMAYKTNLLVFLRPVIVRDGSDAHGITADRYDYIRGQVANSTVADNIIFRDLESRQMPERPPVAPSMRRSDQPAPPPQAAFTMRPPGS